MSALDQSDNDLDYSLSGILLTINDRSLSLNQQLVNDLRQFQHFNF